MGIGQVDVEARRAPTIERDEPTTMPTPPQSDDYPADDHGRAGHSLATLAAVPNSRSRRAHAGRT